MSAYNEYIDNNPEQVSTLIVFPELEFNFTKPMPNWWWRMWQFVLLGWRWRNYKEDEE